MLYKILVACCENGAVWPEFEPNLEVARALDVSESGVELKVGLEIFGEEKLDLHRVLGSVVQDDSLSVELLVNEYV